MRPSFSSFQSVNAFAAGLSSVVGAIYSGVQYVRPAAHVGEMVAVVRDARTDTPVRGGSIEVLTLENAVVATLTVVEDSRLGLPIDEAIGAQLGARRAGGRRIGELGALAVDPAYRAAHVHVLIRLFRIAVLYGASIARLDELAFVIHPRHLTFYRALFPFREMRGGSRSYRRLDGVCVLGLWFDLALVRALLCHRVR